MYQPIQFFLEASLYEVGGVHRVKLTHLTEPPTNYAHVSTVQSDRPYLILCVYWQHVRLKNVRVLSQFRQEIETFLKAIIAADPKLSALVDSQTGGEDWHL